MDNTLACVPLSESWCSGAEETRGGVVPEDLASLTFWLQPLHLGSRSEADRKASKFLGQMSISEEVLPERRKAWTFNNPKIEGYVHINVEKNLLL